MDDLRKGYISDILHGLFPWHEDSPTSTDRIGKILNPGFILDNKFQDIRFKRIGLEQDIVEEILLRPFYLVNQRIMMIEKPAVQRMVFPPAVVPYGDGGFEYVSYIQPLKNDSQLMNCALVTPIGMLKYNRDMPQEISEKLLTTQQFF
jgi:hypothetical protein